MAVGRRALNVGVALLAAAAMLLPAGPARADCSLGDIANAIENTFGSVASGACASACADGAGCGVASGMAGVLAGVPQGTVNNFCGQVQTALGDAQNIGNGANAVEGILGPLGLSSLASFVGDAAAVGADPLNIAACACSLEQGINQLGSDFGSCVQQALCDVGQLFGQSCSCSPPPPTVADCAQSNAKCDNSNNQDLACVGAGPQGQFTIMQGYDPKTNTIHNISPYYPAQQYQTSGGTLVTTTYGCGGMSYCFCPKPMEATWTLDVPQNNANPNNCSVCANNYPWYVFSCNCPGGTHADPSGALVNGISVCLCDKTNQPADFNPESFGGPCPPPACPTGQVRLSSNGNCVTPCSDPTKGMTMDGACCDPARVTACGFCCPGHTLPNPLAGTCTSEVAQ
jgi:hypothetical protein